MDIVVCEEDSWDKKRNSCKDIGVKIKFKPKDFNVTLAVSKARHIASFSIKKSDCKKLIKELNKHLT